MREIPHKKKLLGWGAGETLLECMAHHRLALEYVIDNDEKKWNSYVDGFAVHAPEILNQENLNDVYLIIFSTQYGDIVRQLNILGFELGINTECFLFIDIFADLDSKINIEKDYIFLEKLIKPGYVCIDVGANHGIFSKRMAKLVGTNGIIHSIEPQPNAFHGLDRLRTEYKLKNMCTHNIALTSDEKTDSVQMTIPTLDGVLCSGMATITGGLRLEDLKIEEKSVIKKVIHGKEISFSETNTISVRSSTLDSLVTHLNLQKIDFIKIDVEGFELEVLRGALDTLSRFRPILQVEVAFNYHNKLPHLNVFNLLEYLEYEPYYVENNKLVRLSSLGRHSSEYNFYFLVK